VEVDRASLSTVLAAARGLSGVSVGVNVHAATLSADLDFVPFLGDLLAQTQIAPERVVLEIVEHGQPYDHDILRLNLEGLRSIGLRLALDDFGTGQANCMMLLECRPHYLKIDRYFVNGCHEDPMKQALLASLAGLARSVGARALAEGVEADDDLALVRSAGIGLAQGYFFARPAPTPAWGRGFAPSA
jgi:EAL domain-containing protein (putative c-di-GMP-specific phosphodiesterase class I)